MRRFKIAFFWNAVLLMCITYLSRDSCRNLIYKNLGPDTAGRPERVEPIHVVTVYCVAPPTEESLYPPRKLSAWKLTLRVNGKCLKYLSGNIISKYWKLEQVLKCSLPKLRVFSSRDLKNIAKKIEYQAVWRQQLNLHNKPRFGYCTVHTFQHWLL